MVRRDRKDIRVTAACIVLNRRDARSDFGCGFVQFSLSSPVMKTYAPSATKRLAVARTRPLLPPVKSKRPAISATGMSAV